MTNKSSLEQRYRRLHSVASQNFDSAAKVLQELEQLGKEITPAPEASGPKKRLNKYQEHLQLNESVGSWRKPVGLRKTKVKK